MRLDRDKLGLKLVVFAMIRTRHHSTEWLQTFRRQVALIDEVVDFHRIGGDYDYLLKVVVEDIAGYDAVYQRLIEMVEFDSVTAYFAMEPILEGRPLPVRQLAGRTATRRLTSGRRDTTFRPLLRSAFCPRPDQDHASGHSRPWPC